MGQMENVKHQLNFQQSNSHKAMYQTGDKFDVTNPKSIKYQKQIHSQEANAGAIPEDELPFSIQHFFGDTHEHKEDVVKMPALGRMKLWESIAPVDNKIVNDVLKTMRHSWMAVPFMPAAAFASELQTKSWDRLAGKVAEAAQDPVAQNGMPPLDQINQYVADVAQ